MKKTENVQNNKDNIYVLNKYFEYEIKNEKIYLHLPIDLHYEFEKYGKAKATALIGKNFIDALLKVNKQKNEGLDILKDKKLIYMMSPIFFAPTFYPMELRVISANSPVLEFLKIIGANITKYTSDQLVEGKKLLENDIDVANDEIKLAIQNFGIYKDIGVASISFKKLNSRVCLAKLKFIKTILEKYIKDINDIKEER